MKVIFLADKYKETFIGGAEMAFHAVIEQCEYEHEKVSFKDLTDDFINENIDSVWVIGNFAEAKRWHLKKIAEKCRYFLIEFDFKIVPCRNIAYHFYRFLQEFNSPIPEVVDLFKNAQQVFFMSRRQMDMIAKFVPPDKGSYTVLSSMFCREEIERLEKIMAEPEREREKYLILGNESWVKGFREALLFARKKEIDFKILFPGITHEQMLEEFKGAIGLIYLPAGEDTCPRTVIEARLLGCKMVINNNVLNHDEQWFCLPDVRVILHYLKGRVPLFWKIFNVKMQSPVGCGR